MGLIIQVRSAVLEALVVIALGQREMGKQGLQAEMVILVIAAALVIGITVMQGPPATMAMQGQMDTEQHQVIQVIPEQLVQLALMDLEQHQVI